MFTCSFLEKHDNVSPITGSVTILRRQYPYQYLVDPSGTGARPRPQFYQTRSTWSKDQGSTKKRSAVHNFVPTVTKFCVLWEGLSLPHDTKFGNCRGKMVDRRVIFIWSLILGSSWSCLIKVGPGCGRARYLARRPQSGSTPCWCSFLCPFVWSRWNFRDLQWPLLLTWINFNPSMDK